MELYTDVAGQYADFAAHARSESTCFEQWALGVLDDPEVLVWLGSLPAIKQQPNLVFAAARWHGVPAPGPYAGLRRALLTDDGSIRATILSRATQTNEVGRLATLVPAFATVTGGSPVALLEVGASAGLCLYPDRYRYAWRTDTGVVSLGDGPVLDCDVTGDPPLPQRPVQVGWRGGIDLNPLDVHDDDAMRWLRTLVWPEQHDRRERLAGAVAVARREPPDLVVGDLLDELPALVERAGEHGPVLVFHTAVIAYLEPDDRARFDQMMTGLVGRGRCHWVSNEGERVLPRVTATGPTPPDGTPTFVLGVDGRAVAWTHGHGRSMTWFG